MRRISKRLAAPLLAAALLLGTAIPAWGYFTAWDQASGGFNIPKPTTEITEDFSDHQKKIVITNTGEAPVWVRAKAAIPADLLKKAVVEGTNWTATGDKMDWYNYDKVVEPGAGTDVLLVKLEFPFKESDVQRGAPVDTTNLTGGESRIQAVVADGTTYNVVVVYEMQPVVYNADGTPKPAVWE